MGFERDGIRGRRRSSWEAGVRLRFLCVAVLGVFPATRLRAEPGLESIPNVSVSWHPGACSGGISPGSLCFSEYDCPGRCVAGVHPGAECNGNFSCPGACSALPTFHCSFNVDCSHVGGGTCTAPPPGTCSNPASGTCEGASFHLSWSAVQGATGYDAVGGDLDYLHQTGILDGGCLANNTGAQDVSLDILSTSYQAFFLVRAVMASSNGTYDEGGGQVGSRDGLTVCP